MLIKIAGLQKVHSLKFMAHPCRETNITLSEGRLRIVYPCKVHQILRFYLK